MIGKRYYAAMQISSQDTQAILMRIFRYFSPEMRQSWGRRWKTCQFSRCLLASHANDPVCLSKARNVQRRAFTDLCRILFPSGKLVVAFILRFIRITCIIRVATLIGPSRFQGVNRQGTAKTAIIHCRHFYYAGINMQNFSLKFVEKGKQPSAVKYGAML